MLKAARPTFSAQEVFEACCRGITDPDRKQRLASLAYKVDAAAADYVAAGMAGNIHQIDPSTYEPLVPATGADFVWLYENRLVRGRESRRYYDQLMFGNRGGRCSLCNVSPVAALDHHLPKKPHAVFAVTPDNLLPACDRCNKIKLSSLSPILNIYFDDLGQDAWLRAEILESGVVDFFVEPQKAWSEATTERALNHFELFRLRELYVYEAQREMTGTRHFMKNLFDRNGEAALRANLAETAKSWEDGEPNSWQAALYAGLQKSNWFCSGGFAINR